MFTFRDRQRQLKKWQKQFGRQMQEQNKKVCILWTTKYNFYFVSIFLKYGLDFKEISTIFYLGHVITVTLITDNEIFHKGSVNYHESHAYQGIMGKTFFHLVEE